VIRSVTPDSIKDFIPDFPDLPPMIPVQLVSDLLRLTLLERFGGVWMDYSTILTTPLDWAVDLLSGSAHELLAFYNEFPGSYRSDHKRPIIENGFLVAKKGSSFIIEWKRRHLECLQSGQFAEFHQRKENYAQIRSNFVSTDEDAIGYLACYLAAQDTMLDSDSYSLLLRNAEEDYYYIYYNTVPARSRWRFAEEVLLRERDPALSPKLIKITRGHRAAIDEYIHYGCYRSRSLLGRYVLPCARQSELTGGSR
jgi:hypothetical protein